MTELTSDCIRLLMPRTALSLPDMKYEDKELVFGLESEKTGKTIRLRKADVQEIMSRIKTTTQYQGIDEEEMREALKILKSHP